jgi:hypothetical protein
VIAEEETISVEQREKIRRTYFVEQKKIRQREKQAEVLAPRLETAGAVPRPALS